MPSGRIALRLLDGRSLRIFVRAQTTDANASPFIALVKFASEPGSENGFRVLSSSGVTWLGEEQKIVVRECGQLFWNPLHQAFLRLNERGDFDCSPPLAARQRARKISFERSFP